MNTATALRLIRMPGLTADPSVRNADDRKTPLELMATEFSDKQAVDFARGNPLGDPELESTFLRSGAWPRIRR